MKNSNIVTLISKKQIKQKVEELGTQRSRAYQNLDQPLVLIGILKGSVIFLADLCRAISIPLELEFMGVSSYSDSGQSFGVVKITQDLNKRITDRDVLLVEDIVDTGLTAKYIFKKIKIHAPKSIGLVSLLEKPTKNKVV